jgi:polyisoprenoid-binding protein YceI
MKKILPSLLIVSALTLVACKGNAPAELAGDVYPISKASGDSYSIDTSSSNINWVGSKITGSHNGTVNLKSGSITAEGEKITGGKVEIDMPTITNTDLSGEYKTKLETHLKDTDFFEVGKFPAGTFEIASISKTETGSEVRGNLTLKGITKGIQFPISIVFENGKPKSATGTASINRQQWGIVYKGMPDDLISDTIQLKFSLNVK